MATLAVTVDDRVKEEADQLFGSLGLDTDTAVNIFLKASIEEEGIPFPVRHPSYSLSRAIQDSRERKNLHGPYATAEEAVKSMLED